MLWVRLCCLTFLPGWQLSLIGQCSFILHAKLSDTKQCIQATTCPLEKATVFFLNSYLSTAASLITFLDVWLLIYHPQDFIATRPFNDMPSVNWNLNSRHTQTQPADMSYCIYHLITGFRKEAFDTRNTVTFGLVKQRSLWLNWPNLLWWVMQRPL